MIIAASNPLTDAVFVFRSLGWLVYVIAGVFFLLGILSGRLRHRRSGKSATATAGGGESPLTFQAIGKETDPAEASDVCNVEPGTVDDLQKIRGIGKALCAKLHVLEVYRFEQIANWDDAEIAAVAKKLQLGNQISAGKWRDQAAELLDSGR